MSIEKTQASIIEAFVCHTKIGYQKALTAARRAIAEGKSLEDKLEKAASGMGLWPILAKNWEGPYSRAIFLSRSALTKLLKYRLIIKVSCLS